MHLFEFQDIIAKNLIYFIRLNGYTITSLVRLTCIPKIDLEKLLSGEVSDPIFYDEQIKQITKCLNLPIDYFLQTPIETQEKWQVSNIQFSQGPERSRLAQELLDDLNQLITIASFYIKK